MILGADPSQSETPGFSRGSGASPGGSPLEAFRVGSAPQGRLFFSSDRFKADAEFIYTISFIFVSEETFCYASTVYRDGGLGLKRLCSMSDGL